MRRRPGDDHHQHPHSFGHSCAHTRNGVAVPTGRWITLTDAADELSVSTKTVRRWIAAGHLTARRAGPKLLRVDRTSIDAMMGVR